MSAWTIKQDDKGGYRIFDEHGVIRGSYADGKTGATHHTFALQRIERQQAEIERLRVDARRYRWLVEQAPQTVAAIAYREPAACVHSAADPDLCVDTAMAAGDNNHAQTET